MPPIPIYTNAPTKPSGVTPQTAAPEAGEDTSHPQANTVPQPTRTTNPSSASQQYDPSAPPPPQPGARPVPAPTGSIAETGPAPPMPGAHPQALPSVTETHISTTTLRQGPPPQFSIPPPTQGSLPTHSTNPTAPPNQNQLTIVPLGPVGGQDGNHSLAHPPGYVQNPYAADGTAEQRAKWEAEHPKEDIWGTVKNIAGQAAESLQKAEQSAWKWAEGKSG